LLKKPKKKKRKDSRKVCLDVLIATTSPLRSTPRYSGAGSPLKRRRELLYYISIVSPPFQGGRPSRNCPVGNFREEPVCREAMTEGHDGVVKNTYKFVYSNKDLN
jgi:hypothetical protein